MSIYTGSKAILSGDMYQLGGHLWGQSKSYNPNERDSFDVEMALGWMESRSMDDQVFKGNKLTGLYYHQWPRRDLIKEEVIGNQRIWVVDVVGLGNDVPGAAPHEGVTF